MAKKSKSSKRAKKKKTSLSGISTSSNNQAVETAAKRMPSEINQLVALKKVNRQQPPSTVETRSDVVKEAEKPAPSPQIDWAESSSLVAATKSDSEQLQLVAEAQHQENDASTTEPTKQEEESTAFFQAVGII